VDVDFEGLQNKADNIRLILQSIIEELSERDRVSIILTDNEAKRICPLIRMTTKNMGRALD